MRLKANSKKMIPLTSQTDQNALIQAMNTGGEAYLWFVLNDNAAKHKFPTFEADCGNMASERMNGTVIQFGC
jgi:hypothetical protein